MPRRKPPPDRGRPGRYPPATRSNAAHDEASRQRQRAVCAAKARYATDAEARAHALMHQPGPGSHPSTYRCEVCGGWHFTSRR